MHQWWVKGHGSKVTTVFGCHPPWLCRVLLYPSDQWRHPLSQGLWRHLGNKKKFHWYVPPGPAAKVRPIRPRPYRFLREKKWRCLHSNLRVRYRVASPSSSPSLRDLHSFSSFQASKVATREFKFLSFRDIYSDTCARGECTNWGGANMRVMCGSHFWQLGSIASPATKTTGDSSSILPQTWPQKRSQSA